MTVALGASAYSIAIFHLFTHAFFKALLFLAAGSVIVALHHEQDMRNMGGLRKRMPITYWTALMGTLALVGFPGFSGFFSKDAIIEAVRHSHLPGAGFAYVLVLAGVFVTAFYSFRLLFLVFHGKSRMSVEAKEHVRESPRVITVPLILLAIPSVFAGLFIGQFVFGNYFAESLTVSDQHGAVAELQSHYQGLVPFVLHSFQGTAVWLVLAGIFCACWVYLWQPQLAEQGKQKLGVLHKVLLHKYGFDELYQRLFAGGIRRAGSFCDSFGDRLVIDGLVVNGFAKAVNWCSLRVRNVQSGYLYHYAFTMIIGLLILLGIHYL